MNHLVKLTTDLKESQSLPFIEKIAKMDGLRSYLANDFNLALNKFRMILLICEQNGLQYWVNRDFRIANQIFDASLDFRTETNTCQIHQFLN